jgi:hypothetical protein
MVFEELEAVALKKFIEGLVVSNIPQWYCTSSQAIPDFLPLS